MLADHNKSHESQLIVAAMTVPSQLQLPSSTDIGLAVSAARRDSTYAFAEDHAIAESFRSRRNGENGPAWDLLAQIFDFQFHPRDAAAPFGPMAMFDGKRSLIPDDLTDEQLDALENSLTNATDSEYRARVGDILWLRRKNAQAARKAIEAYVETGKRMEDPDNWVACVEQYERAVRLARSLGKSEALLDSTLEHLLLRVRHYRGEDKLWLTHRLLCLLYEFDYGDAAELAAIAAKGAAKAKNDGDLRKAVQYHDIEAKLHRRAGDSEKVNDALRAVAERYVDDAEAREASGSYMVAHKFWNEAIQSYRRVPNSGDRIKELQRRMNAAGEKMRAEMKTVGTEFDFSEQSKRAQQTVDGLQFEEAICLFVAFVRPIDPARLRSETEQFIREHPLSSIVDADIFDGAGRKVDVRPSALTTDAEEYDRAIRGHMSFFADIQRFEKVMGTIAPAMRKILEGNSVDNLMLENLIGESRFIPAGRLSIFIRSVRAGLEWDFSTALHLLIPQVENSLRHILAQFGVITTTVDAVGIEETWPLGRILNEPKLLEILGESLVYELRTLLLGQPGLNLRNLLAHGLVEDAHLNNNHNGLYLWWLVLRLVVWATPQFEAFAIRKQCGA
jgi:Domain of unknown function (DUF4209)